MESIKIVLLCVGTAIIYGICQDMVTAHLCVEYFTVGHPPVFGGIADPVLLALSWGVIATWWVGLMLGVPAAILARIGSRPKLTWRDLRWPLAILFVLVAVSAISAWPMGWFGEKIASALDQNRIRGVSGDRIARYMGNAAAHTTAYVVGFIGGVLVWGYIWWKRGRSPLAA